MHIRLLILMPPMVSLGFSGFCGSDPRNNPRGTLVLGCELVAH